MQIKVDESGVVKSCSITLRSLYLKSSPVTRQVVNCFGVARVNGVLAVARAFGNRNMRTVIRADPEIQER